MGNIAISVENLGKRYRIGLAGKRPDNFREAVSSFVKAPFRYLQTRLREPSPDEIIWALKDVSFEAKHGEVIGIIGRNGAGKSTLLKILSRITEPTEGLAKVYGRVGSLLEVGTGFHPELTGRENIYLNGAILGMRRAEIDQKFDEIVQFAEIEKFIDTPVKRYSSGMYVRLAFAVAAHLEPEILLVDEVLAVGDVEFQKKCLGKIEDVSHEGRTVLLVSHNMHSIRSLCSRSILIEQGKIFVDGSSNEIIQGYYERLRKQNVVKKSDKESAHRWGSGEVRFTEIRVEDEFGKERFDFLMGSLARFILSYQVIKPIERLAVHAGVRSGLSYEPLGTTEKHWISQEKLYPGHTGSVVIEFPTSHMRPGEYPIYFGLTDRSRYGVFFDIIDDLTSPLAIYTNKNFEELGYDPTKHTGSFTLESRILRDIDSSEHVQQ